jgi:GH24 family phage-related lysozyme (muramidase)
MRPVVQKRIISFNTQHEGYIHHMYLDVKGLVTVGVGNLLASAAAATALPFTHGLNGSPASSGEKSAAWNTVRAAPAGRPVSKDGKDSYGALTDLRLTKAAIDKLVLDKAMALDALNPIDFPAYPSFCADAQLGLLSMRWPGSWHTFPTFQGHVKNGRWFGAARECFFDETGNSGLKSRNKDNRWLFSLAGRVAGMGLDPGTLYLDNPGAHKLYLFKGGKYVRYDWDSDSVDSGYPLSSSAWSLPSPFSSGVDAAVNGLGAYKVPKYFGKTYFFRGPQYVRYDWDSDTIDLGPSPLSLWGLSGAFANGVDAALNGEGQWFGKLYFFKGDKYVRYDWATEKIDQAPVTIAEGWQLPPPFSSGIDAVVSGEGPWAGKLYFFKGDKYIRCNWDPYKVEGPAQSIGQFWGGLAGLGFANGLGAAVNAPGRT